LFLFQLFWPSPRSLLSSPQTVEPRQRPRGPTQAKTINQIRIHIKRVTLEMERKFLHRIILSPSFPFTVWDPHFLFVYSREVSRIRTLTKTEYDKTRRSETVILDEEDRTAVQFTMAWSRRS
jgi:hypothetical protein